MLSNRSLSLNIKSPFQINETCSLKQFFRTAVSGSALSQPDSLCVSLPLRDVYRISPLSVSLPSLRPSFTGFLLSAPSNSLSLHMSSTKRHREEEEDYTLLMSKQGNPFLTLIRSAITKSALPPCTHLPALSGFTLVRNW